MAFLSDILCCKIEAKMAIQISACLHDAGLYRQKISEAREEWLVAHRHILATSSKVHHPDPVPGGIYLGYTGFSSLYYDCRRGYSTHHTTTYTDSMQGILNSCHPCALLVWSYWICCAANYCTTSCSRVQQPRISSIQWRMDFMKEKASSLGWSWVNKGEVNSRTPLEDIFSIEILERDGAYCAPQVVQSHWGGELL